MKAISEGKAIKEYKEVLLFGGTTEGRVAAEKLLEKGAPCTVCVATSYGEEVLRQHPLLTVHAGRLDRTGMAGLMREGRFSCVVDATHPHAQAVSQEITAACREAELPYLRLDRDLSADLSADGPRGLENLKRAPEKEPSLSGRECVYVDSVEEAAAFFAEKAGRILVTTGSKELVRFASALGDASRITARVLPSQESLRACAEAGLTGKQIIAMQGPFDTEMNCAMIRHTCSDWLLTKETGAAGGYPDKIEAARSCGIGAVVIRRPAEPGSSVQSAAEISVADRKYSLEETVAKALQYAGVEEGRGTDDQDRRSCLQYAGVEEENGGRVLYLVGTGVGAPQALTDGAREAIDSAQVLFGAGSVLDNLKTNGILPYGRTVVPVYESDKILQYLVDHPHVRTAAALYSGDSGFYSGASSMLKRLEEIRNPKPEEEIGLTDRPAAGRPEGPAAAGQSGGEMMAPDGQPRETMPDYVKNLEVKVIPGISCVSWFAARVGIPWQDWKILSSHGRFCNVVGQVLRNHRCFLLLAGAEDLRRTAELLFKAQANGILGVLQLVCGYELSRPGEEVWECEPRDLLEVTREGLYVLLIQNDLYFLDPVLPGMSDMNFWRQKKVPMTSREIRVLSLSRLGLTARPVVWDVGAGTGSVSIEAALACPEGRVYSIECRKPALEVLRQNRDRYCPSNMEIIEGTAPEVLKDLPAPTHVFIGGSGGKIERILFEVFWKNPCARVVVNCVTAETLADLYSALSHISVDNLDCMQVSVNRMKKLGRYHALHPQNPVFIISFNGRGFGTGVQYVAATETCAEEASEGEGDAETAPAAASDEAGSAEKNEAETGPAE